MNGCVHEKLDAGGARPPPILRRQGHTTCTERPPSHGTRRVGSVSPASFNRGLCARLLRRTITARDVISIAPGVSTTFRNNLEGLACAKPFSRPASLRYRRSASTV